MTLVEYAKKASSPKKLEREMVKYSVKNESLTEYRCSCGRLLGRFNGQAEVKCPKCGKMNVIGANENGKS